MGSCPGSYQILRSDYRAKSTINAVPCFPPFAHKNEVPQGAGVGIRFRSRLLSQGLPRNLCC